MQPERHPKGGHSKQGCSSTFSSRHSYSAASEIAFRCHRFHMIDSNRECEQKGCGDLELLRPDANCECFRLPSLSAVSEYKTNVNCLALYGFGGRFIARGGCSVGQSVLQCSQNLHSSTADRRIWQSPLTCSHSMVKGIKPLRKSLFACMRALGVCFEVALVFSQRAVHSDGGYVTDRAPIHSCTEDFERILSETAV